MTSDLPIVLIHGLFGGQQDPNILSAFGDAEVHAPDLLGYGQLKEVDTSDLTLEDQAQHVAGFISGLGGRKVHLVGHSVGGAVSALVARRFPHLIASFTSVEGNFTLNDAFWSGQIARKPENEVADIVAGYMADPDAWISAAGVPLTAWTSALARDWLAYQPASTIKAQAKAVVAATGDAAYLNGLRELMASEMPVHLIAGGRSAEGWDTPTWADRLCTMRINIAGLGHLMMAENPAAYARAIRTCTDYR